MKFQKMIRNYPLSLTSLGSFPRWLHQLDVLCRQPEVVFQMSLRPILYIIHMQTLLNNQVEAHQQYELLVSSQFHYC